MNRLLFLMTLAWLHPACAYLRHAKTPMPVVRFTNLGPQAARGAIILLPGFGDHAETFDKRGFVAALRRHAPEYDVIAADAHFGYYRKRILVERLEEDVIGPLRAEGYRELWLAGTSMGGFGSVAYARVHPERIVGLLLFAPYMGPRSVIEEVRRVGLCAYTAPRVYVNDQQGFSRANFGYLRKLACEGNGVVVWLAVGAADRLVVANELLGKALARDHFLVLPGGHGWKVWTPALEQLAPRAFGAPEPSPTQVAAKP